MTISAAELPNEIQTLLDERAEHIAAISKIDSTLAGVTAALGGPKASSYMAAGLAAPKAMAKAPPAPSPKSAPAKKRGRGSFSVSATELVLQFLKGNKNATTKAITAHLVGQGRSPGAVSNALSVLTTAKKLKRTPLGKGQMGSTYSLV